MFRTFLKWRCLKVEKGLKGRGGEEDVLCILEVRNRDGTKVRWKSVINQVDHDEEK